MAKVKVFSTTTCPWCTKAKTYLKEHKIEYEDFDVAKDVDARNEMMQKSGQMGVPVLDIDGEIVIGFDQEKINQLLKIS